MSWTLVSSVSGWDCCEGLEFLGGEVEAGGLGGVGDAWGREAPGMGSTVGDRASSPAIWITPR